MTAKRFTLFDDGETIFDNETVAEDGGKQIYWVVEYGQRVKVVELLNELHEENQRLKDQYERKDRQLKRTKKDIQKYTDYFMNELEWDFDRILKEVFR